MLKNRRVISVVCLAALAVALFAFGLSRSHMAVLSPAGTIASSQRGLLGLATGVMLLIVIPVFGLVIYIPWKYRASNTANKATDYRPEWDGSRKLETLWWGFPFVIVLFLAVIAGISTHKLDPARPLRSASAPITIQVVALQWKWLFIYPAQHIASVNYVQFPAGTPVNFQITADAPMNSFWIPRLGGQIYAMAGMTTQLHLMADQPGSFHGSSANLSGEGFSAMQFTAEATTATDFSHWVTDVQSGQDKLSLSAYTALARPNIPKTNVQYAAYEPGLYAGILEKYMAPGHMTMTGLAD